MPIEGDSAGTALVVLAHPEASSSRTSFRGDRVGDLDRVLHPLMHGTLAYTGMEVLDPFVAYAADSVDDATRTRYLAEPDARLRAV